MFDEHLPASYRDRDDVPHIVRTDAGDDVWVYDGREFPNIGFNAVAGRPRMSTGSTPPRSRRCGAAAGTSTLASTT